MQPKRVIQPGWKGGQGRPRKDVAVPTANAVAKLARSRSEEALRTLVTIMREKKAPGNVRIKACEAVLHRGIGLPTQPVDITVQRLLAKRLVDLSSMSAGDRGAASGSGDRRHSGDGDSIRHRQLILLKFFVSSPFERDNQDENSYCLSPANTRRPAWAPYASAY
jgi:hypothetical protein